MRENEKSQELISELEFKKLLIDQNRIIRERRMGRKKR
jgi:hypothetical protein